MSATTADLGRLPEYPKMYVFVSLPSWMKFAVIAILLLASGARAVAEIQGVMIRWNNAALQGIRDAKLGAPVVARAMAIVTPVCTTPGLPTMIVLSERN